MFAQQDCKNLIKILTESTTKRAEILETARIAKHFCADKGDIFRRFSVRIFSERAFKR